MERQGVELLVSCSQVAVVGITEVFSRLPAIWRALKTLKVELARSRPDLLILIDFPDFNIHLAGHARRLGIPVLYYISPQVWAWRRRRVRKIGRRVSKMAVILPFEETFYRKAGINAQYVGHPLMDAGEYPSLSAPEELRRTSPVVGVLPGSRVEEVKRLLPAMLGACGMLKKRFPGISFVLPKAEALPQGLVESYLSGAPVRPEIVLSGTCSALSRCHAAMVASGTATLETAIVGVPMVILYKVSTLSYIIGRMVIRVPSIGLVNLVAERKVALELIQHEVTPERLAEETARLLEDDAARRAAKEQLRLVREKLGGGGASLRTAIMALDLAGVKDIHSGCSLELEKGAL
jgi:lipid-A-disaccharide synthase